MQTECQVESRELQVESQVFQGFARGFVDHRDPELIEHTVEELLRQRVSSPISP